MSRSDVSGSGRLSNQSVAHQPPNEIEAFDWG
jgi:hypothetical protein